MSEPNSTTAERKLEDIEYQRELDDLSASLNEAAADLERNGPVSKEELLRSLREMLPETDGDVERR